jgi:hemolysin D
VLAPAQPLLVVVPLDNHLDIEARVSNRDIGFVEAGQEAEIKVATFNFTRYGLLHGRVLMVSRDAIGRDDLRGETPGKAQVDEGTSERPAMRNRSTQPASRSTANRCKSRPRWSTSPLVWL